MKKTILEMFEATGNLSTEQIFIRLGVALLLGVLIFLSYRISHAGTIYSRKFNFTLLMLTLLTTGVMAVIGNNLALSLGMVGALSIVRFRTAIKDSRDTAYIFWTIIVGICCGAGDFMVAAACSGAAFILTITFGYVKNDDRMLLILRGSRESAGQLEAVIYSYFGAKAKMRVKNTTSEKEEMIWEISGNLLKKAEKNKLPILDAIYEFPGVEYANLVAQNDDIRS
jgi:uncharacterized membrane protein YhiD involved in acid resistance